jgi:SAM-dependent methyltransferase
MFMLRRDCLAYATRHWTPGRFVEVGAGTGRMTTAFLERGFTGICYDLGDITRDLLRRNLAPFGASAVVVDSLGDVPAESCDYVMAFEVLEHLESDAEVLRSWLQLLKPGGRVLVSVPAHARKYSDEDRAMGHYRRYERQQLKSLLSDAGCTQTRVYSYGFPIAILTRRGSRALSRWDAGRKERARCAPQELSILSGIERSAVSIRLSRILNRHTLAPFIALQRLFFDTDLGDGYVGCAMRAESAVGRQTEAS